MITETTAMQTTAIYSDDKTHRYLLRNEWNSEKKSAEIIMLYRDSVVEKIQKRLEQKISIEYIATLLYYKLNHRYYDKTIILTFREIIRECTEKKHQTPLLRNSQKLYGRYVKKLLINQQMRYMTAYLRKKN